MALRLAILALALACAGCLSPSTTWEAGMRARLSARAAVPVEPAYAAHRNVHVIAAPGLDAARLAEGVPAEAASQTYACDTGRAVHIDRLANGAELQATWRDTGERDVLRRAGESALWRSASAEMESNGVRLVWRGAGAGTVIVRPGDTLGAIARRAYGDPRRAYEIAALNSLADPNRIFPGQVLRLPGAAGGPEQRCRRIG